ncbi:GTP-binding protein [Bradyrhizobium sp. CB1650]|uniref:CobW family GTP-binding protein n=1 Tax=Bradyrhizobium sp. CB1650 TaxID=3039153 RepID=UPI0024352BF8|nr:GTP-binding protein [Bradyrhizobium sp. CB1650]WGD50132.1 GTP-binding protein [Bradyrhizobium sp. CB1650]
MRTGLQSRLSAPEFVLLTGSLGSGKTTLLCDYLSLPESADIGVIVNEAGEINVDGAVVSSGRRDLPMTLLGNGCVCCSCGDDLHAAIDELLALRRQSGAGEFRRIVLETSGLAMPGPILRSLMRYNRAEYRLRIISTLDAANPETDDVTFPIRSAQLTAARSIVVTKLDRVSVDDIASAESVARQFNPAAGVIATVDRLARTRAAFAPTELEARAIASQFHAIVATDHSRLGVFLAEWPAAVPWRDLCDWLEDLAGLCGDRLLRVKGLVSVGGVARPILIDGVGTTFAEPSWVEAAPSTGRGIVIIARDVDLDELTSISGGYSAEVRPTLKITSKRAA